MNSTNADNGNADDEAAPSEKPGTSRGLLGKKAKAVRDEDGEDSRSEESEPKSDPTLVKVRNASRERPLLERPRSKRLRIVDDNEDDGIQMDAESSSEDDMETGVERDDKQDDVMEVESAERESVPVSEEVDSGSILEGGQRETRSTLNEDVSTTMQLSTVRQRPSISGVRGGAFGSHYDIGDAIASTSAAVMAPSLSKTLEASSVLEKLQRDVGLEEEDSPDLRATRSHLREGTPTPGCSTNMDNLYFQKKEGVDVNENRGPEFLDKLQGNQRLMWARKLFFLSTELVFPGFTAYSDRKSELPDYMGLRVRSSCMMQAVLYADSLFFVMWILSFLSTADILVTVLKELHGYLVLCLTCLFVVVNILRLRFGLKGNENDEVQYLALFWMITVIVQIPLFTFIFLTDLFCPVLMAFTVTMDGTMMAFILLESIIGFIHFRSLLRDELNIIRMARRSKEASQSRANVLSSRQDGLRVPPDLGISKLEQAKSASSKVQNGDSSSDADSDNENDERAAHESMDFRMQIRRLSGAHADADTQRNVEENEDDSDSSEQVSSTSDTIRQRPIRAH